MKKIIKRFYIEKRGKKKKHKHNWEIAQENCFACGSYSMYCTKENCGFEKTCTLQGNCSIEEA